MSDSLIQTHVTYVGATADAVWQALTTSEGNNQWGYGGDVELDLRPGGVYRNLTTAGMKAAGMGDVAVSGEVVEVDPGRRLVVTWQPAWAPESTPTTLTWELTEFPGPLTRVVLTHDLTATPDQAPVVAGGGDPYTGTGGWPWSLAGLKTYLETGSSMVGSGSD